MSVFPSETFPADSTIQTLNGQTDQNTGLPYVPRGVNASSTPSYEVQYNRRQERQNKVLAPIRAGMVVDEGSLDFGVYPISYRLGGVDKTFAGATAQAVADNATTYVWLDNANALQTGASLPVDLTTFLPLAQTVTLSGSMTITDLRSAVLFEVPEQISGAYATAGVNADITELQALTVAIALANGGTGATTAAGARANMGAAASGANSDITSLAGLTTALSVPQGGTGGTDAPTARTNLGAAASGANADITSLTGLTTALSVAQGGTGLTVARVVPYTPVIALAGALTVKVYEIEFVAPVDFTIKNVTGRVNTAPTGAALICDARVDGNSIFTNQGEMVNVADGTNSDTSATKDHAVTAGSVVTFEIEQVGSTVAGSDLTLVLNGRCDLQG